MNKNYLIYFSTILPLLITACLLCCTDEQNNTIKEDSEKPNLNVAHSGKNVFLHFAPGIDAVDASEVKQRLREQLSKSDLLRPETDEFLLINSKRDKLGNIYYRFQQQYEGLPVHGKTLVVQTDRKVQLRFIGGLFQPSIILDVAPNYDGPEAFSLAYKEQTLLTLHSEPELNVFTDLENPILVYKAIVEYVETEETGEYPALGTAFVDANKGEVVKFNTHLYPLSREIYTMDQTCLSTGQELPGTHLFGEDNPSTSDEHAYAAYENTGIVYWFFFHYFGRDSFDNQGITLKSSVHGTFRQEGMWQCHSNNAFFAGEPYNQMIYGDGDSVEFTMPAAALDITAHEFTHGVTASESGLEYSNESGAVNEALSDIFGAATEAWSESGGSAEGNPPNGIAVSNNTWACGEDAVREDKRRYMHDPAISEGTDCFTELRTGREDNGYVHINSSIMNLAFYLLSQGGEHPRDKSDVTVPGMGIDKALEIYYHASTNLFTSQTGFEAAREFLAQSAQAIFGNCSPEWEAVHLSFDAVNVPGDWETCSINQPDPCEDVECSNHGTCILSSGEASCQCDQGYSPNGLNCELNDPCSDILCENWETCNQGACLLNPDRCYDDSNCQDEQICDINHNCIIQSSPCEGVDCSQRGQCTEENSVALCLCHEGYHSEGLACVETQQQTVEPVVTITASTIYNPWYLPEMAIDGNWETAWVSQPVYSPYQEEWIELQFDIEVEVNRILLHWIEYDFAHEYSVFKIVDGNWVLHEECGQMEPGTGELNLNGLRTQHLLIMMRGGWIGRFFAISELEILFN